MRPLAAEKGPDHKTHARPGELAEIDRIGEINPQGMSCVWSHFYAAAAAATYKVTASLSAIAHLRLPPAITLNWLANIFTVNGGGIGGGCRGWLGGRLVGWLSLDGWDLVWHG